MQIRALMNVAGDAQIVRTIRSLYSKYKIRLAMETQNRQLLFELLITRLSRADQKRLWTCIEQNKSLEGISLLGDIYTHTKCWITRRDCFFELLKRGDGNFLKVAVEWLSHTTVENAANARSSLEVIVKNESLIAGLDVQTLVAILVENFKFKITGPLALEALTKRLDGLSRETVSDYLQSALRECMPRRWELFRKEDASFPVDSIWDTKTEKQILGRSVQLKALALAIKASQHRQLVESLADIQDAHYHAMHYHPVRMLVVQLGHLRNIAKSEDDPANHLEGIRIGYHYM